MCNQKDCQHEKQEIIVSDRDLRIGNAFMATMFMRIIKGTRTNHHAADWMIHAGACAIGCTNPECETAGAIYAALEQAVDHVDNGAELHAVALYNKAGILIGGKAPTAADRLAQMFKGIGIDLAQFSVDGHSGAIDTVIVDPIPAFIDVSAPNAPVTRGRSLARILTAGMIPDPDQLN